MLYGGKIFMGLIFVVEETHENFNTTKLSVYMVAEIQCVLCIVHVHVHVHNYTVLPYSGNTVCIMYNTCTVLYIYCNYTVLPYSGNTVCIMYSTCTCI